MNQLMSNFRQPQQNYQHPPPPPPHQSQGYRKPSLKKGPAPVHQQAQSAQRARSMRRHKEEFGGRKKSESEDLDLEVGEMDVPDIEIPDINLVADFDVPDVDFNVSDI